MAMYDPEYLRLARALCDRYEVHLICDEIAVGCGRTGTFFAHEQAGIKPDFLCLSKGISGGYLPLSIVLTTDAVYAAFYDDATRAASCIRTPTPATRWPAARRWRRSTSSTPTMSSSNNVARGALLESLLRRSPSTRRSPPAPARHDPRVRRRPMRRSRLSVAASTARRWPAKPAAAPDRQHRLFDAALHRQRRDDRGLPRRQCRRRAGSCAEMIWDELQGELDALAAEGLKRRRRTLDSPCGPVARLTAARSSASAATTTSAWPTTRT
jgi:hypothetical protein